MKRILLFASLLFAVSGLSIGVLSTSAEDYSARYFFNPPWHWAGSGEIALGVEYGPGIDPVLLGSVLKDWSASSAFELGVVGPISDPQACDSGFYFDHNRRGTVTICYTPDASVSSASMARGCTLDGNVPGCEPHIVVGIANVRANTRHLYCHELGHTLGLQHGGGGCLESGTGVCPSADDFAALAGLYHHDDGYSTALSVEMTQGEAFCGTAQPTATPKATNTPRPKKTPPGKR
jgi:hypothetical protein